MVQINEGRKRGITVAFIISLGILLFFLLMADVNISIRENIIVFQKNQSLLADLLLKRAVIETKMEESELVDNLRVMLEGNYPTSSSSYGLIAKNDTILFLKDENTTTTLMNEKISTYFDANGVSTRDLQKYIISKSVSDYDGNRYTLVICTKQNYLLKKIRLNEMKLHCLSYFVLYGIILLVIIALNFYKLRAREKQISEMEQTDKNNLLMIERFQQDRNKNYVLSEREDRYSFYSRTIVEQVISQMEEEQKRNCIQIDIYVENLKMEHFIFITAVLGRIKEGNSISCYWKENQFKILIFDQKEEAQQFIDLFVRKYKAEYQENVEELKIVASRLVLS
jgi:hypothetical protein